MARRITISYDIVTPESAEQGDFAETGWENEEGIEIVPDEYDLEEHETELAAVVALACKVIGCVECSSSPWTRGSWYIETDGTTDYSTGECKRLSYHLEDFSEIEQQAIYARLTWRMDRREFAVFLDRLMKGGTDGE